MVNPYLIVGLVILVKGIVDEISGKSEKDSVKPENEIIPEIRKTQVPDIVDKPKIDSEKPEKVLDEVDKDVLDPEHDK